MDNVKKTTEGMCQMKRIMRIIFAIMMVVSNASECMEAVIQRTKKDPTDAGDLLAKNGKYLKKFLLGRVNVKS